MNHPVHHVALAMLTTAFKNTTRLIRRWNQTHVKFLIVTAVIVINCLDDAIDFTSEPSQATPWNIGWLVVCCFLCALSLLSGRYNWIGPLILVVCFNTFIFSPYINAFESGLTYLYAMAYIAYVIGHSRLLAIPAVFIVVISLITIFSPYSDAALDVLINGFAGLAFGIIAHSWQSMEELQTKKEKLARLQQQQDEERGNLAIAAQIHDRIANDAAGIIAIADTSTLDPDLANHAINANMHSAHRGLTHPGNSMQSRWSIVAEKAKSIYQESHKIMSLLESNPSFDSHDSITAKIKEVLQREQIRLNQKGLEGQMTLVIQDGQPNLSTPQQEEMLELIHELSTNIYKHMETNGTFNLTVSLNLDSCRIVSMNSTTNPPITRGSRSGKGLSIHRRLLEQFGGSLTSGIDDDMWIVTAIIPR